MQVNNEFARDYGVLRKTEAGADTKKQKRAPRPTQGRVARLGNRP